MERDLKDLPQEYYECVFDSLEQLRGGYEENNAENGKALKSNRKLSGLHEIKPFKVRVVYRNLSPDVVYVLMAKMKKSNNSKKDREDLINRKDQTDGEFENLSKMIEDEEVLQELIDDNAVIYDRITKVIKEKGRD